VIDVRRGHKRGSIPSNYVCSTESVVKSGNLLDFKVWSFVRMIAKDRLSQLFPSFSAINSLLSTENVIPTSVDFTPILPNPITEFESVYTIMVNFQDVLMQKSLELFGVKFSFYIRKNSEIYFLVWVGSILKKLYLHAAENFFKILVQEMSTCKMKSMVQLSETKQF
jgi:hypothetical protein